MRNALAKVNKQHTELVAATIRTVPGSAVGGASAARRDGAAQD
jgi:hypothetical protein